jgi:hypothetical protein
MKRCILTVLSAPYSNPGYDTLEALNSPRGFLCPPRQRVGRGRAHRQGGQPEDTMTRSDLTWKRQLTASFPQEEPMCIEFSRHEDAALLGASTTHPTEPPWGALGALGALRLLVGTSPPCRRAFPAAPHDSPLGRVQLPLPGSR